MKRHRRHLMAIGWLLSAASPPSVGQVFTSEFVADPVAEGWELSVVYCEPETWNENGWYHQQLDLEACPPGPGGGRDSYLRSLEFFNGSPGFFVEFRVETDGERSELAGGAPVLLAIGNFAGVNYHVTVARDLIKFLRDVDVPIWFIEVESDMPHVIRIELRPNWYVFYIDGSKIVEGAPEGPFPAHNSQISWRGRSWYLPCHNAWDYIRYGHMPEDGSGDYDRDGETTLFDWYFMHDCLTKDGPGIFGGPDENAGPGCRFTDFDADADADLLDFAEFQNLFGS